MDFVAFGELHSPAGLLSGRLAVLIVLVAAIVACFTAPVVAADALPPAKVTVAWEPSPSSEVVGYNLYFGTAPRAYNQVLSTGPYTNCVVTNLIRGTTYYFAATALDRYGLESDFSEELIYVPPLLAVMSLARTPAGAASISATGVQGYTYQVQASENLKSWTGIGTVTANSLGEIKFTDSAAMQFKSRFYRLRQIAP